MCKKLSDEFSISSPVYTVTEVPTVEIDWGFLLGAITIVGMSFATSLLKKIKFYEVFHQSYSLEYSISITLVNHLTRNLILTKKNLR